MKTPEGKWMPRKLTEEMRDAAFNAPAYGHPETAVPTIPAMYEAMYEAAPTPGVDPYDELRKAARVALGRLMRFAVKCPDHFSDQDEKVVDELFAALGEKK